MPSSSDIADRILEAILAQRLAPGTRLGEQQLAVIFAVSRTIVREALTRLSERGVVTVNARRGWYVIEPSPEEAQEAFTARRVIELGMLRHVRTVEGATVRRLKAHLARERSAVRGNDIGARSFLLGDFHVCLAECIGNGLLADTLRDLTARTTLIAMLYQSSHEAEQSCDEHVEIVAALEAGDFGRAEALMSTHIGGVEAELRRAPVPDALAHLRDALAPVAKGDAAAASIGVTPVAPAAGKRASAS
ncbi:MAG: GntR family transcriptional regulator, partial [Casimicrobiaceae bacterium]